MSNIRVLIFLLFILFIINNFQKKSKKEYFIEQNKPKIVHQTYKTKDVSDKPRYAYCQKTVKKYLKDYKYMFWTDEDIEKLVNEKYPEYKDLYYSLTPKIKRIDFAKYLILYTYGGFYIDLDFEIFKDIFELVDENPTKNVLLADTAIFYTVPKHKFWLDVFEFIKNNKEKHVLDATGPEALKKVFNDSKYQDVIYLNDNIFFSILYEASKTEDCYQKKSCREKYIKNNAYGIHHYEGFWLK